MGSMVGITLEVDGPNLNKYDYVRAKIGCKDLSKVPAVIEGVLDDLNIYDFFFQREIPREGQTNPAGNTWVRVDVKDKPGLEHPSPKKAKLNESSE
uniref:Uncharacterized protein n=1 Tax=Arundo donax TaxID=35708 RepID=A0A0A8XSL7_ARUDO